MLNNSKWTTATALVILVATLLHADYPHGVMPDGASIEPAKRLAKSFIGQYCKTHTEDGMEMMSTYWTNEAHGYAMLLAAYCYDDDATLKKLWNFCRHMGAKTSHGLLPWAYQGTTVEGTGSALDGNVDIAIGLDWAAQKWPNSDVDWDAAARYYTRRMYEYERNFNKGSYVTRTSEGLYYNNYSPFPFFHRFYYRTNIEDYKTKLVNDCYYLSLWSLNNWRLPAWTVNGLGEPRAEKHPDRRDPNPRWNTGPARFSWRVGHHALATGDQRALKWSQRIIEVYDSGPQGDDPSASYMTTRLNVGDIYKTYNAQGGKPRTDERNSATTIMGAGVCAMAVGNKTLANKVWNWVKNRPLDPSNMIDAGSQAIGALIMSGEFDVMSTEKGHYPPKVVVNSPENGKIIAPTGGKFIVNFDVDVVEQHAAVKDLTYYEKVDGELVEIARKTAAPWSHTWSTTKGAHRVELVATDVDGRPSTDIRLNVLVGDVWEVRPYSGALPEVGEGTVTWEAEHFDYGGQNVAYYDNTPDVNRGAAEWGWLGEIRPDEGVDIKGTREKDAHYIAFTNPGPEWTEYSFKSIGTGTFDVSVDYATDFNSGVELSVSVDGSTPVTQEVSSSGGWETFATVTFPNIPIDAGNHVIRLTNVTGGANLDKLSITAKSVDIVRGRAAMHQGQTPFAYLPHEGCVKLAGLSPAQTVTLVDTRGRTFGTYTGTQAQAGIDVRDLTAGSYFVMQSSREGSSEVYTFIRH